VRVLLLGGGVQPIPPTGYGAVERIVADLAVALTAAGHQAVIINRVRHRRMRDEYPFARELPRLIREERYDVLHANTPVVANRLALGGYPFVYTSHSRHWFYRAGVTHRWGYWLERRAVARAGVTIALTERLRSTMEAVVRPAPDPPPTVIPFGVDAGQFAPRWDRRSGRVALGVGVVLPFKRWDVAAAALKGTGVHLRLAGPLPSDSYAEEVRHAGDTVELLGEVSPERLRELYATSDLLVHPSRVEVLSATVLEALASGLPVVGGPAIDTTVETGRTGFIVPDADPAAFVQGLRRAAMQLEADDAGRRAMGEEARRVAEERYAWPRIVEQHLKVYRGLAAG
jgi:glycosyltransferase involved in cell wall biosynthesis